jgi:hypothetical protein
MSKTNFSSSKGTLSGQPLSVDRHDFQVQVINGRAERIHNIVVHQFRLGDIEDPMIYAAEPLLEWQKTEEGQWVMAHAIEQPMWHQEPDALNWGHRFAITAKLRGRDYTFWTMKWGSAKSR